MAAIPPPTPSDSPASVMGRTSVRRACFARPPHDVPAAIGIVLHWLPPGPGHLAAILTRALPVTWAVQARGLRPGRLLLALPDLHLLAKPGDVRITRRPRATASTRQSSSCAARQPLRRGRGSSG
jgi:hypothetical protein